MFALLSNDARGRRIVAFALSLVLHWSAAVAAVVPLGPVETVKPNAPLEFRFPSEATRALPEAVPPQTLACGGSGLRSPAFQPLVLIRKPEPDIFVLLRGAKGLRVGIAVYSAKVDVHGHLTDIKVLRSLGPLVDQIAMESLWLWRYEPARWNGLPCEVDTTITLHICP